jgi:uncharacterized phage protein (TIGR02220 family)
MARMSIDDMVQRDPRVTLLAAALGWSRRETLGCLVGEVWPICYDQRSWLVSERVIDAAAGHAGFAAALIECELATRDRSGKVQIRGAKERISYLENKSRSGRQGGLRSAESRNKDTKQTSSTAGSTPQAPRNPPVPDPASVSAPDPASSPVPEDPEKNSARPSGGGSPGLPGLKRAIAKGRKIKPNAPTPAETRLARVVLEKLGGQNGVQYTGTTEHIRLIVARLREGIPETDLRAVIGYCSVYLDWSSKPEMEPFLRPETLFGPKTISKYLDAARRWMQSLPEDKRPTPTPLEDGVA